MHCGTREERSWPFTSSCSSSAVQAGKFVREQQEEVEVTRPSRQEIETVNFALIDADPSLLGTGDSEARGPDATGDGNG